MKRVIIFFALLIASVTTIFAASYSVSEVPNVQLKSRYNFVSNPDGILSKGSVARIDSICYALKVSNIAQVAVVAVEQITEDNKTITADPFNFAYKLFSSWGVGREGRNNGLGILFVEAQRQIRFVTGTGVEGVLPDAICKRIQTQYMVPHFRSGDYDKGLLEGVKAIESILASSELNVGGSDYYPEAGRRGGGDELPPHMIAIIIFLVVVCPIVYSMIKYFSTLKCPNCGKYSFHAVGEKTVMKEGDTEIKDKFYRCSKCSHTATKRVRESHPTVIIMGGGGRRGGGGFGGGGGGGFGGGRFGGGGAGSGW